jgi:hypothetical protein
MANGHGGYRKPTNPAPVSGPGAHSRRTDGKQPSMDLPDADYGEGAAFQDIQSSAPLAQTGSTSGASAAGAPMLPSGLTGLGAPTTQPDMPVTDGADYGMGAGQEALGLPPSASKQDAQYLSKYLPTLISIAERDDTPPGTKAWVRNIIAQS